MVLELKTKRRYLTYLCLLFNAYVETCARFGVSIAMIGGMVKEDCNDPTDTGKFCWSEKTQAMVLGAYFYGHTVQCLTTYIANRYTGFTTTYRVWLVVSAVIQLCYPKLAELSTSLIIVTQTIRGILAGIMVAYHFDYIAKFSVGKENKALISIFGANDYIGQGTGGLIAGLVTKSLGWQYYFYLTGAAYILGLIFNLIFVNDSPQDSWYLTQQEKDLILKTVHTKDVVIGNPQATKSDPSNTEDPPIECEESSEPPPSLKSLICRLYLLAFCIYIPAYNLIYFNLLNVVPFYLNKVLGADPLFISSFNVALSLLIAFCTLAFSFIFQKLDKKLTWFKCRMG